jgi:hypothetical protein
MFPLGKQTMKKPFGGLGNFNIINKSSKSFVAYVLETQTAQPRGKSAVIYCLRPWKRCLPPIQIRSVHPYAGTVGRAEYCQGLRRTVRARENLRKR